MEDDRWINGKEGRKEELMRDRKKKKMMKGLKEGNKGRKKTKQEENKK